MQAQKCSHTFGTTLVPQSPSVCTVQAASLQVIALSAEWQHALSESICIPLCEHFQQCPR